MRHLDGIDATPYVQPAERAADDGARGEHSRLAVAGDAGVGSAQPNARPLVLIAATNRACDLDRALLSRFALKLTFPLPDAAERAAILGVHAAHLSAPERERLARDCDGASGRTIRAACDAAERSWASRLVRARIAGRSVEASAPPAAEYDAALRAQCGAERRLADPRGGHVER